DGPPLIPPLLIRLTPLERVHEESIMQNGRVVPSCIDTTSLLERFTLGKLSIHGAHRWPDAIALIDDARQLTFRELDGAVARFAGLLSAQGVEHGDAVAVLGTKSAETVIALLAVARLGATYVALDANLPRKRMRYVLDDCAPRLVLGAASHAPLARPHAFVAIERCWEERAPHPVREVSPREVAYVIYTSGSTGHPKGVCIEHQGIEAFFRAHNARANIQAGDRCMNTGPFHFDVSVIDVFLPLYCGATVVLTPELPMPKLLLHTIERHRITHFYAVGSILSLITGNGRWLDAYDLSSLRMLQTGAEVCNPRVVNEWLRRLPSLRFLNSYGPTELTVGCTCYLKPEPGPLADGEVPIGTLHEGSEAVLLDADGQVSEDSVGELAVAGAQLMRGYLRRPEEARRALFELEGKRFYRTGDIVRRAEDGTFFYVGRRDHEVKIDGYRVHLNEVKRCLEGLPDLASALVFVVTTRQGRSRVGAAVVPREPLGVERARALLSQVASELPAPFVPCALLLADELPRTPTGKADAGRALRELERQLATSTDKVFFTRFEHAAREHAEVALAE
ncbi:MAG TPA: amino acid adenylation domain-containing protein, partial [Polyangiales bacterium]